MFELRMIITTRADGAKVLTLGAGFRVAFGIIAAFILVGSYTTGSLAVLPGILAVLSLVAVFYDERWVFDMETKEATRHFGLVFLRRTKTYSLENAEYFEYGSFLEGSGFSRPPASQTDLTGNRAGDQSQTSRSMKRRPFQRSFETLTLVTSDGDRVDIEKQRGRETGRLKEIAERLSEYTGIPLRSA